MSHDVDITVHHLYTGASPPPTTDLLDSARDLVDAATAPSRWHSVKPVAFSKLVASKTVSNTTCYTLARSPPVVSSETRMPELKEWDDPLEEMVDAFDVSSLPEFESTNFDELLRPKNRIEKRKSRSRSRSPPTRHFADNVGVNVTSRFRKRRRSLSPTHISISALIPFPHYHESPDPACPPPPEIERIPAFRITRGTFVRTATSPFARTAWLVPLRGSPPFNGASSASLHSSNMHSLSSTPLGSEESFCIQWTPRAITEFWTFLMRQRSMNNFGPIAFSYAFGPLCSDRRQGKRREDPGNQEQKAKREWEYVKIYHDARYALKIRSLLDSFRWDEDQVVPNAPRRNRVLKGARLVLTDEQGEVMILA